MVHEDPHAGVPEEWRQGGQLVTGDLHVGQHVEIRQ
jgi:hypothetical protein